MYVCGVSGYGVCVTPAVLAGIGCTNGVLYLVDAITLQDLCEPFAFSKDCITHIAFSQDSRFLATAVSLQCSQMQLTPNTVSRVGAVFYTTLHSSGSGLLRDCVCAANKGGKRSDVELLGATEAPLQANHGWVRL